MNALQFGGWGDLGRFEPIVNPPGMNDESDGAGDLPGEQERIRPQAPQKKNTPPPRKKKPAAKPAPKKPGKKK